MIHKEVFKATSFLCLKMIMLRSLLLMYRLAFRVDFVTQRQWLSAIYEKHSRNFRQNVNGKTILAIPTAKPFRNKGSVLKGSPKFPTEILEWKMYLPFAIIHHHLGGLTFNFLVTFGKLNFFFLSKR